MWNQFSLGSSSLRWRLTSILEYRSLVWVAFVSDNHRIENFSVKDHHLLIAFQNLNLIHTTLENIVVFSGYSGFFHQSNWPPRYNWNTVEVALKHPNLKTCQWVYLLIVNENQKNTILLMSFPERTVHLWCCLVRYSVRANCKCTVHIRQQN